ncbi:carbohydrate-binding family V/XII [Caballeronia ptereochthonis]|uniref:Carbohydrate-binding family V/XII n=1 Tax=Caballeronia ptereochthonis TaxID=1777144 RepID=A0A158D257_9BURK|nr:carbohydrate-binding family V/XII [Caballeronia ptereochthonis]SAK88561.1 hypothetical protein AWB83_04956 [Caballeronia ptereochthonis]
MSALSQKWSVLMTATCLAFGLSSAHAANPPASAAAQIEWPRELDTSTQRIEMYQPQIEQWNGNRIAGRAAVAVGAASGNASPTYGVAQFTADADIDKASGLARLANIRIGDVTVPTRPGVVGDVKSAIVSHLPPQGMTVSLDQLQTSYAVSQQVGSLEKVAVRNPVPDIVFASTPTILVMVDGEPAWRDVSGAGYQRALNSRAMLLKDGGGHLYLHAAGYWYAAATLNGPWGVLAAPPQALVAAAKQADAAQKSDPMTPQGGKPAPQAPAVLLATHPAELVVTDGPLKLEPVAGVNLLTVTNTDHAIFVVPQTNQTYVLVSGRWFRAPSEKGPWQYVPGNELPPDFAKISPNDPKANVLVSVPGTPQAKEAAIAATIPQTATVARAKAAMNVSYDGSPRFEPISGTSLEYAVNTATPVIEVSGAQFYAVQNGVWFTGGAATGPWHVATEVPGAIYTIPASSPLHYVTYVRIYSVTPDAVVVGYTPGYMGVVVSDDGTVVYGTGYAYQPYVGATYYYGYPPTYGYGAGFALSAAEGFAFGFAAGAIWGSSSPYWGPYWGGYWGGGGWANVNINQQNFYGRWGQGTVTHTVGYNPWTGNAWRGTSAAGFNPATGAHWQGSRGAAFNPYSGNFAAGRQGGFANPMTGREGAGRAGVVGNAYTGNYAAGRAGAVANPATGRAAAGRAGIEGNAYDGNYAAGRQVAGYNAQTGRAGVAERGITGNVQDGTAHAVNKGVVTNASRGNAVAWNNGDVYAAHDGNVYQHTEDGGWQQHTSNGWQPVQHDNSAASNNLDQMRQSRETGQQRFDNRWSGGGGFNGGGGGFHGGGGGFHGGFRR